MHPDGTLHGFPESMPEIHRKKYLTLEADIAFNEQHGINQGYTQLMRDEKHRLIATYLEIDWKAEQEATA